MADKKIVIRSKGEFEIDSTNQVYELDLKTGMITKCMLQELGQKEGKQVFKIIVERAMCIYMPAINKEHAKVKFNKILNSVK